MSNQNNHQNGAVSGGGGSGGSSEPKTGVSRIYKAMKLNRRETEDVKKVLAIVPRKFRIAASILKGKKGAESPGV